MAALCKRLSVRSCSLPCSEDGSQYAFLGKHKSREVGSTGLCNVVLKDTCLKSNSRIFTCSGYVYLFSLIFQHYFYLTRLNLNNCKCWNYFSGLVQFNKCNWGSFMPIHATDSTTLSFQLVSTTLSFESRHFPRSHFQDTVVVQVVGSTFFVLQDEEYSVKVSQVLLLHPDLWQYHSD